MRSNLPVIPARRLGSAALLVLVLVLVLAGCAPSRLAIRESRIFQDCPTCDPMRSIPAGQFLMGSPENEAGRQSSEGPLHRVSIPHPFAIGIHDVTVAEYRRFIEATGYAPANPRCNWRNPSAHGTRIAQTPEDPVVCVRWDDAQAYLKWLSEAGGHPYRLPAEAEWEYAARAGSTAARPWGADSDPNHANTGAETCCGPWVGEGDHWLYTSPVGSFPPNAFGLFDMIGNVWQWTLDCGSADYRHPAAPLPDPMSCATHIVRGGGWFHPPELARSAARAADDGNLRVADIGFRVARSEP